MKIHQVPAPKYSKSNLKESILYNAYYAAIMYLYVVAIVVGVVLVIGGALYLMELYGPEDMHIFNYRITSSTIDNLIENKQYQTAIYLSEVNNTSFEDEPDLEAKVIDCYIQVGLYSKSIERLTAMMGKPLYDDIIKPDNIEESLLYKLYNLYLLIGNTDRARVCYDLLSRAYLYKEGSDEIFDVNQPINLQELTEEEFLDFGYFLRFIQTKLDYQNDPQKAIAELESLFNSIANSDKILLRHKLMIANTLTGWKHAQGANTYDELGLDSMAQLVRAIKDERDFEPLGELADYFYIAGDTETSFALNRMYERYLDYFYDKEDLYYLSNSTRGYKYTIEKDGIDKVVGRLRKVCENMKDKILLNFDGLSSEQREMLCSQLKQPFDYAQSLLLQYPDNKALAELCFDNISFTQGLLLRSDNVIRQRIARSGNLQEYDQLMELKKEWYAREGMSGIGNSIRLRELKGSIEELEKKFSKLISPTQAMVLSSKQLSSALKSSDAIVELFENNGTLCALTLTKEGVRFSKMGDAQWLRDQLSKPIRQIYTDTEITRQSISPALDNMASAERIYYVPNGVYNQLSLQALPLGEGRYLCDRFNISMLSNPSEYTSLKHNKESFNRLALWGGIDYGLEKGIKEETLSAVDSSNSAHPNLNQSDTEQANLDQTNLAPAIHNHIGGDNSEDNIGNRAQRESEPSITSSKESIPESSTKKTEGITRGIDRGRDLYYLPGSKTEIEMISRMFPQAISFEGMDATEESFRENAPKAEVLHISTHGFFETDRQGQPLSPMYGSGLMLANSNAVWTGKQSLDIDSDDGILRSYEIAQMDLSECRLVVLSACDTALGYIDNTEGVYGLQRAFKLAGAGGIIMSLWKVQDYQTSWLMNEFYNLLKNGESIETAFNEAIRKMKLQWPNEPEYWGAFVLLN